MSLTHKDKRSDANHASTLEQSDFDTLFDQNWDRICEVLYRLVGDWDEAEDLALETFLRLHQKPPRDRHNVSGWLYRVGMNLGYNAIRGRGRRQGYEQQAGVIMVDQAPSWNPDREFERAQERENVRLTLARMKPRSAKLLILRHSGFSYAEISKVIQVSPSSVGTLLARAEREFEKKYR